MSTRAEEGSDRHTSGCGWMTAALGDPSLHPCLTPRSDPTPNPHHCALKMHLLHCWAHCLALHLCLHPTHQCEPVQAEVLLTQCMVHHTAALHCTQHGCKYTHVLVDNACEGSGNKVLSNVTCRVCDRANEDACSLSR